MTNRDDFGAVKPDNLRTTSRRQRRDPDADTPPPAPAAPPPAPVAPAPVAPPAEPSPAVQPSQPAAVPPPDPSPAVSPREVARPATPPEGGTLASVLTAPDHTPGGHEIPQGVAALAGLASMRRRPVDPMQDWVADGNRLTRWMAASVRQFAMLTGRKIQDVQRDALLGLTPIPPDILDANWLDCYGYPREQYNPQDYR